MWHKCIACCIEIVQDLSGGEDTPFLVTEESSEVLQKTCPPEYENLEEKQVVVWVDPVDGTKEYTEGTRSRGNKINVWSHKLTYMYVTVGRFRYTNFH